jgi:hypothetical protein
MLLGLVAPNGRAAAESIECGLAINQSIDLSSVVEIGQL